MSVVQQIPFQDYESSVSPKGQITLPIGTRKRLDIKPKDKVTIRVFNDGGVAILPKKRSFLDHYKSVPALKKHVSYKEMRHIAYEEQAINIMDKNK
jgi:AbrB family looped-hinge helix DNA binding protein